MTPATTQQRIIQDFKAYLQQVGYSRGMVDNLPRQVAEFLSYHPVQSLPSLKKEHIQQFYEHLQTRPNRRKEGTLSERMISHFLYALRLFFAWLEDIGQIKGNPISGMRFKRPQTNTRQPLSPSAIHELFQACQNLQETAMLHLFYSCGLRRSEAVGLNSRDIHFKQQLLYVRRGKGAKRRVVPMTEKVSQTLECYYLEERSNSLYVHEPAAFMLNQKGRRMQGNSYNRMLKTIIGRTQVNLQTSLHHLRHSIATHLLQAGVSVLHVRDFLGHRHLESTKVYAKVHPEHIRKL